MKKSNSTRLSEQRLNFVDFEQWDPEFLCDSIKLSILDFSRAILVANTNDSTGNFFPGNFRTIQEFGAIDRSSSRLTWSSVESLGRNTGLERDYS